MKVYSREVADLLLALFDTPTDCAVKACGTFTDMDSILSNPQMLPNEIMVLVTCAAPTLEASLPESADVASQSYLVPIFALQKLDPEHPSKPWEAKQALANLLLSKLDPWARLQERKRDTRPSIDTNVTLNAATLMGVGYDSIPELQAAGWYVCDVTIRLELGVPRT